MATLSVMILTYNHARYISSAINSVLTQKTRHKIKILIVDDSSTDGTSEIVEQFRKKFPNVITVLRNKKNKGKKYGIQSVVYEGFKQLDGDSLAILEGDDYWTDELKIDKQLAWLEVNPTLVASAHNTVQIFDDENRPPKRFIWWEGIKQLHDIRDFVAMTSFFHISSLVFRNVRKIYPDKSFSYIRNKWCCDIYFNIVHLQFGNLIYLNEDMSVYRKHSQGNFSNLSEADGRIFNINGHRKFNRWLRFKYFKEFAFAIFRLTRGLLRDVESGKVQKLSIRQQIHLVTLREFYGLLYDLVDRFPRLDPAVIFYNQKPKAQEPRLAKVKMFD